VKRNYHEPLLQTLETELGGTVIFATALKAAKHQELQAEFKRFLDETGRHLEITYELFESLNLDRDEEAPARLVVRHLNESLVDAMDIARLTLSADVAEVVACECAMLAQSKEQQNWDLLSQIARVDRNAHAIRRACQYIADQEDSRVVDKKDWCRDLWLQSLGLSSLMEQQDEGTDRRVPAARGITPRLDPLTV